MMKQIKIITLFSCGLFLFVWIIILNANSEENPYRAESDGNLFQITTPYGSRVFFSESPLSVVPSYQFEVTLADLKPSISPENSPREVPPQNNDSLVIKANELYNRGKFKESLEFIEELLQRDPKHARGWIMKGSLMHMIGQKDLAKKAWSKALEIDPSNSQIKTILGRYE